MERIMEKVMQNFCDMTFGVCDKNIDFESLVVVTDKILLYMNDLVGCIRKL